MLTLAPSRSQAKPIARRGRPLLPVQGVASLTSRTIGEVVALIDDGELAWAWDLAPERGQAKRLLRVLPMCVDYFLTGQNCPLESQDVLSLLLPDGGDVLWASAVYQALNINQAVLYDIIRKGELVPMSNWRRGRFGSARLSSDSLSKLLRRRRYPMPEATD